MTSVTHAPPPALGHSGLVENTAARPLSIDLFCGLGGWTDGLLAAGYDVIGFDIERHVYGAHSYPAQLVLQDVCTLHGSQFRDATIIVASSPCQGFSYRAMPWKRAKALPPPHLGMHLFAQAARIQREACAAAGRYIPMIQENVCGAQPWVGRARWHYGSYYLWGDVPALMPIVSRPGAMKVGDRNHTTSGHGQNPGGRNDPRDDGVKQGGDWFSDPASMSRRSSSRSTARKAASARIAKIPFRLAEYIAQVYHPSQTRTR